MKYKSEKSLFCSWTKVFEIIRKLVQAKLFNNFIYSFGSTVGVRLLSLAANILIANTYGKETFGQWSIFLGITMAVMQLAIPNLASIVVCQIAQLREKDLKECSEMLGFLSLLVLSASIFASGSNFFFADEIAQIFGDGENLGSTLRWFSLPLFLLIITSFFRSSMIALEGFKHSCIADLTQPIVFLMCVYLFDSSEIEVLKSLILGFSLSLFVCLIISVWMSNRLFRKYKIAYSFRVKKSHFSVLWYFCMPGLFAASARGPVDIYTKSRLTRLDSGWGGLGGVQAALNLYMFVAFIPMIICRVTEPKLNRLKIGGDYQGLKRLLIKSGGAALLIAIGMSFFVGLFGKWMLGLYGEGFVQYYPVLLLLLIVGCVESIDNAIQGIYAVFSKMWIKTGNLVVSSLIFLLLAPCLIRNFDISGYVYALLVARLFSTAVTISITFLALKNSNIKDDEFE